MQMEDVNAWECGRPIISERPPGSSEADDALGLDHDALNGTLSAFEQNSFGIQSAFHVDSDSDEVKPHLLDIYTKFSALAKTQCMSADTRKKGSLEFQQECIASVTRKGPFAEGLGAVLHSSQISCINISKQTLQLKEKARHWDLCMFKWDMPREEGWHHFLHTLSCILGRNLCRHHTP